jgi:hypothetical protein
MRNFTLRNSWGVSVLQDLRTGISQGSCLSLCVGARHLSFTVLSSASLELLISPREGSLSLRVTHARCMNICANRPARADRTRDHSDRPFRRGYQSDLVFWVQHVLIVRGSGEWACPRDTDRFVVNRTSGVKRLVVLLCGAHTRLRELS